MRPRGLALSSLLLAGLVLLGACKKDNTVNLGAGGTTNGTLPELPDCAAEAGAPPGGGGPSMVPVGRLDGSCFWIDETEVTVAQYAEFLAAAPELADQQAACSWNDSLEPDASCTPGGDSDDDPATCVDWCDAFAYCRSVGKTLCRDDRARPADAKTSSWYSVCSNGQRTDFPYGNNYQKSVCNGADFAADALLRPATAQAGCASGDGVLNLSGNAAEWVDACDAASGDADQCLLRGGSYRSEANALRCETSASAARSSQRADVGFRCCAFSD